MIKTIMMTAALIGATATTANAATVVATPGSADSFAFPTLPGVTQARFDFNSAATPAGFTAVYSVASLMTGSNANGAQPEFSDNSQYLSVRGGGSATLQSTTGYTLVSFFLGSIDTYNTVEILSTTGAILQSYTGAAFTTPFPADGNQDIPVTNRRITYTVSPGDQLVGGIRFRSTSNSAEIDNVVFAVPEPSTWAMMFAGFGMIGFAMRSRRRSTKVVYA
jgi:hypothetical protein